MQLGSWRVRPGSGSGLVAVAALAAGSAMERRHSDNAAQDGDWVGKCTLRIAVRLKQAKQHKAVCH